jgi:hypothetical protein
MFGFSNWARFFPGTLQGERRSLPAAGRLRHVGRLAVGKENAEASFDE